MVVGREDGMRQNEAGQGGARQGGRERGGEGCGRDGGREEVGQNVMKGAGMRDVTVPMEICDEEKCKKMNSGGRDWTLYLRRRKGRESRKKDHSFILHSRSQTI